MDSATVMVQLELDFQSAIATALEDPIHVPTVELCYELESLLAQLPETLPLEQRMSLIGNAVTQIAEVYMSRAEHLLGNWQETYDPPPLVEPEFHVGMIQDLMRQTLSLDLEEWLDEKIPQQRKPRKLDEDSSIAGAVDKADVLSMVEQLEQAGLSNPLSVAYDEDISGWQEQIQTWAQQTQTRCKMSLADVMNQMELPISKVWLALLLHNPPLQWSHTWTTAEEFYAPHSLQVLIEGG
jgi:hypothetical protein